MNTSAAAACRTTAFVPDAWFAVLGECSPLVSAHAPKCANAEIAVPSAMRVNNSAAPVGGDEAHRGCDDRAVVQGLEQQATRRGHHGEVSARQINRFGHWHVDASTPSSGRAPPRLSYPSPRQRPMARNLSTGTARSDNDDGFLQLPLSSLNSKFMLRSSANDS